MYPGSTSRSIPSQTAFHPKPRLSREFMTLNLLPYRLDVEISDLSASTRLTCVSGTVRATVDKSFLDSFVDTYYDQIGIK